MKTHILTIVLLMCTAGLYAQNVGIGTDTPDASAKLDVTSTNSGVLVPRIVLTDVTVAAPVTAPATGLLVWNTNAAITGGNGVGFYYWNGTQWQQIGAGDHNTLDEAYDEGGAGAGRTIDAVDGTVAINGEDGLLVTGTYLSGLQIGAAGGIPEGMGTRMFFNPNKAAFRAGTVTGTQWDNTTVGNYSTAMGYNTTASGLYSTAMGWNTTASGSNSTAMGRNTTASGSFSTAMGYFTTASGDYSTAMGSSTIASGTYSTAMGRNPTASGSFSTAMGYFTTASNDYSTAMGSSTTASGLRSTAMGYFTTASGGISTAMGYGTTASGARSTAMGSFTTAPSYSEIVIGAYNTNYVPFSTLGWSISDRLFVVGNGTGVGAESNALTIYKDGRMNINDAYDMPIADGTAGQVMTTNGAGVVSFQTIGGNHNTLDMAYDEGGAGAGRTIDAVDGTVAINGEDGLLVTGTYGSGLAIGAAGGIPEGAGTRMFFNPNKAAFRSGRVTGTQWDNINVGNYSTAMGSNTKASGNYSTAMGYNTTASGNNSTAMGYITTASNDRSTAMGYITTASGGISTAMGYGTTASGNYSTAMGLSTTASSYSSTAMGSSTTASGYNSTAMGSLTTAPSAYETVIGRYNTNYVPAGTGAWVTSDRLFVVGNGTGVGAESNALTIYKNGKMNINDAYDMPIADGTAGQVMTTNGAGVVSFQTIGGNHNTLDMAYDEGGAGAGRTIDAVDGTVAINGEDGLLVTGTYFNGLQIGAAGGIPEGAGVRMFFNPFRAAFRVGRVTGTQWDNTSVGTYSTAMGYNTTASGLYSTAMGSNTTASGSSSTAMGSSTTASGGVSTAMGSGTTASGLYSTAMGVSSTASGSRSTAMGNNTTASGLSSTAMGTNTTASGQYSTSMGLNTTASGSRSTAMGINTTAPSFVETVIGAYNTNYVPASATGWATSDRLFVVGNGTASTPRDAFVIKKNGYVGIATSNPFYTLHVNGTAGKPGGGTWAAVSDARLKENVIPYTDGLSQLLQIKPVRYHYNKQSGNDTEVEYVGVIAQELQKVAPYMVGTFDLNGAEYLDVDNSAMTYMLINAVQEQQEMLNDQQDQIKALEEKLEQLIRSLEKE